VTAISQWLVVLVLVAFAVMGNLLFKIGAGRIDTVNLLTSAANWQLGAGLCAFGVAAACYILILRFIPLNVAQAFMALQFAATVSAAWLVLGETISTVRLMGLATILLGVAIVSFTQ